jgi:hypothetical protein
VKTGIEHHRVQDAIEGYELFSAKCPADHTLRMGSWGESPLPGETQVGSVRVRPRDPRVPFFATPRPARDA